MDLAGRFRAESHLSHRAGTRRFRINNRYGMVSPVPPLSIPGLSSAEPTRRTLPRRQPSRLSHGCSRVHAIANLALRSPAEISVPAATRERFRGTRSEHRASTCISITQRKLAILGRSYEFAAPLTSTTWRWRRESIETAARAKRGAL